MCFTLLSQFRTSFYVGVQLNTVVLEILNVVERGNNLPAFYGKESVVIRGGNKTYRNGIQDNQSPDMSTVTWHNKPASIPTAAERS